MMKKAILASVIGLVTLGAVPAQAADVGVSISVGQPGFYGQLDIGNMRPPLVYTQPVLIDRMVVQTVPVYLRVPPGHEKHWDKHCRQYNACGRPVYFVRDDWYQREYVPRYRDYYDRDQGHWRDDDQGKGKGKDKGKKDKGNGKGHGHD